MHVLSTLFVALSAAAIAKPEVVTVFQAGEEGYKCFRIPSLLRLPSGAIALFAEGRKTLGCLDHGWVDIVIKVSEDNGTTWGPLRKVYGESNETAHVTIGNPAPVVAGGRVVLLFCRDNRAVLVLSSLDADGREWPSAPVDVTLPALGTSKPTWVATGPPGGIVLPGGRIVVEANWRSAETGGADVASALTSDDGGLSWSHGADPVPNGNEGQVAQPFPHLPGPPLPGPPRPPNRRLCRRRQRSALSPGGGCSQRQPRAERARGRRFAPPLLVQRRRGHKPSRTRP